MDNKKIPTSIGTIIIIVFALTAGLVVWKYEKVQTEIMQQIQNNNQKSNKSKEGLKSEATYKNTSYDYEVKIPSGFSVKSGSINNPDSLVNIISNQGNMPLFSINVEVSKFKNIDEWLDNYQKKLSRITSYEGVKINPPAISSKEKISIDGVEAIKINIHNMPYADCLVAIIKNNSIYTISYNGLLLTRENDIIKAQSDNQENMNEFKSQHRSELDKILESFKFTK